MKSMKIVYVDDATQIGKKYIFHSSPEIEFRTELRKLAQHYFVAKHSELETLMGNPTNKQNNNNNNTHTHTKKKKKKERKTFSHK